MTTLTPSVTLALTHYERFDLLRECIAQVIDDPRIGEIVISDDASRDGSYHHLQGLQAQHPDIIRLYRNDVNVDCHENKVRAVRKARTEWVILFDSDNTMTRAYLDAIWALPTWDAHTVYCPEFAEPHFDYTAFAGVTVDRSNVAEFSKNETFRTALNTCNYFVNRNQYLQTWNGSVDPHTADSMWQMLCWLKAGNRIHIVKGLRYFHRVHDQSHYKLNNHLTGDFAKRVETQLRRMK